jgi:ribosomal protein S12 methylthiotransferase
MKIGFISLGCPKNQLDTEVMLHEVVAAGYELTSEDIDADIIIINTCAFIESAKQEAIDNILDEAWLKENRSLKGIIVTGCLAERYREQILEELPEVDALLGVGSIHNIVEAIQAVEKQSKRKNA